MRGGLVSNARTAPKPLASPPAAGRGAFPAATLWLFWAVLVGACCAGSLEAARTGGGGRGGGGQRRLPGPEGGAQGTGNSSTVSYARHSIIRVWPQHDKHVDILADLYSRSFNQYDFWRAPSTVKRSVDIRVGPDDIEDLVGQLESAKLRYEFSTKDLQSSIEAERRSIPASENGVAFNLTMYHTFDEISTWLDRLVTQCGPLCDTFSIGDTSEGRPMKVIRIGTPDADKPVVWVDAGIHAREWIAPATALHLIDKLLKGNTKDVQTRFLLSRYVWYVMPVANPDGYAYTWTTDRLWRKTRSVNADSPCRGADPNRNWQFHWGGKGTSDNPCSENYRGSRPFSEPETRAMAQFLLSMRGRVSIYLTLHSYGQYWLTPWGFTYDVPGDYGELILLGERATNAMSALEGARQYQVGASSRMLYLAAGGSDDWAKGTAGIRYSYTVELADTGRHGFVLPAQYIKSTGDQMFDAIRTLTLEVIKTTAREKMMRKRKGRKRGKKPQGSRLSEELDTDQASAEGELDELLTASVL